MPVHLDRVWGSVFSFERGRFVWKFPERVPYPVTVSFGPPLPPHTPAHELRNAIRALGEAAWLCASRIVIRYIGIHPYDETPPVSLRHGGSPSAHVSARRR
jgi:hypothetical protein